MNDPLPPHPTLTPVPSVEPTNLIPFSDQPALAAQSRFASPCQGYEKPPVDLVRELVTNPSTTRIFPVEGYSMVGAGILEGSMLIVDTSITAQPGHIVIAVVNGRFVVKQLELFNGEVRLMSRPKNHAGIALELGDQEEVHIWGVVKHVVTTVI